MRLSLFYQVFAFILISERKNNIFRRLYDAQWDWNSQK